MTFSRKVCCLMSVAFYVFFDDLLCVHVLCVYCSASFCSWSADLMKPGIGRHFIRLWEWFPDPHASQKQLGSTACSIAFRVFLCCSCACVEMAQGIGYFFLAAWQGWGEGNTFQAASHPLLLSLGSNACNGWLNSSCLGETKTALVGFSPYFFCLKTMLEFYSMGQVMKYPMKLYSEIIDSSATGKSCNKLKCLGNNS